VREKRNDANGQAKYSSTPGGVEVFSLRLKGVKGITVLLGEEEEDHSKGAEETKSERREKRGGRDSRFSDGTIGGLGGRKGG